MHGVKFENIVIDGKPLSAGDVKQNQFADGISAAP